ncbi:MAG: Cof-type HAD-IIB family hydrolase [Treponema sp.]|jgi:Cof subfamily protein (haloacid dehalogenase superfamily)|nr:Cof-type HAD-IIB family hydrolase [Treponema sp.]
MNSKIIFTDIDGTLTDFNGNLPDSAVKALLQAKENGHKIVLCTGRSKFQIPQKLLSLQFNGIVGAAGGFVEYGGRELYHKYIEEKYRKLLADYMDEKNIVFNFQAPDCLVTNGRNKDELRKFFEKRKMEKSWIDQIFVKLRVLDPVWEYKYSEKALYYEAPVTVAEVNADLAPYFTVVKTSLDNPEEYSGEVGIAGVTKATGMQLLFDALGAKKEDSIAVGDGPNDIEMLEYAGIGIAMGNAQPEVKAVADQITGSVNEDGIYTAFMRNGLI